MSLIGNLFGRSPIRPMQGHMKAAVACAREVLPFAEAMVAGDTAGMERHRDEIERLEHKADDLKNQIRSNLPRRFLMAVERRDMLEILDSQDSIADVAQDVAELAVLRKMTVPAALGDSLLRLVRRVIDTCDHAERVINELDQLVETGFGEREVARVEEMLEQLGRMESETDELGKSLVRELFEMENELGISTVFWYQLINWIGNIADHAERVGNRLRLLIAS